MIKENVESVGEIVIAEDPREEFLHQLLEKLKKDKLAFENNLEMTKDLINIVEKKLKK